MAGINITKKIIRAGREAGVSPWLWGTHGLGKSEVVKQVADELGIGFIDVRAALTEAGDWLGLPIETVGPDGLKIAKYLMSSFLPQDPKWKGILFLDELNRARTDVINCVFQLVLNHSIMNHYNLPKGTSIVAAGNPGDDDYQVTDIDPALLGRFLHVDFSPTRDEWFEWAKEAGVREDVISFNKSMPKMLDGKIKTFDFERIKPNRRGWVMLSKVTTALEELGTDKECLLEAASGLVGTAAAVQYDQFRRSNYLVIDTSKILDDYKSIRDKVKKIVLEGKLPEQKHAIEEIFNKEKFNDVEVSKNDSQIVNLLTFLTDLSQDVSYVGADIILSKCPQVQEVILTWVSDTNAKHHKLAKTFFDIIINLRNIEKGGKKK